MLKFQFYQTVHLLTVYTPIYFVFITDTHVLRIFFYIFIHSNNDNLSSDLPSIMLEIVSSFVCFVQHGLLFKRQK